MPPKRFQIVVANWIRMPFESYDEHCSKYRPRKASPTRFTEALVPLAFVGRKVNFGYNPPRSSSLPRFGGYNGPFVRGPPYNVLKQTKPPARGDQIFLSSLR